MEPIDLTVTTAATHLLDRLDDLYDQRPGALAALIEQINSCLPMIAHSALANEINKVRKDLMDLAASTTDSSFSNHAALVATGDLRPACVAEYDKGYRHQTVEHMRLADLHRVLTFGNGTEDTTTDGMTLLHHAIDVEVDAAAQTGSPLSVEMTRMLVEFGADLNHRWNGQTALGAAITRGHFLAEELLRSHGAQL